MKSRIFWGIVLILLAAALILNICGIEFGLPDGIENRQLILGALCLFWIIRCFIDKKFNHLFFPVAFIVMIFEQEIALALHIASGDLAPWWMLLLIMLSAFPSPFAIDMKPSCTFTCEDSTQPSFPEGSSTLVHLPLMVALLSLPS